MSTPYNELNEETHRICDPVDLTTDEPTPAFLPSSASSTTMTATQLESQLETTTPPTPAKKRGRKPTKTKAGASTTPPREPSPESFPSQSNAPSVAPASILHKPKPKKATTTANDPEATRRAMERKIRQYQMNRVLRSKLDGYEFPDRLDNLSDKRLEEIVEEIKMQLNMHFRQMYVRSIAGMAFTGVEKACQYFLNDMDYTGMGNAMNHSDMFDEELEEISIELSDSVVPNPYLRLVFKAYSFAAMFREEMLHRPVPRKTVDE